MSFKRPMPDSDCDCGNGGGVGPTSKRRKGKEEVAVQRLQKAKVEEGLAG